MSTLQNDISKNMMTSTKEKIIYGLGDVGSNFVWTFTAAFLILYYTDSVGISSGVVGTMLLIARSLDGISDIIMGTLIEKTNSRFGKARPWIIYFIIPFVLSLILLFNIPSGISDNGKTLFMYCTYIFMTVICYTAINLSYHSMLPLISADSNDRNKLSVIRIIMVGFTGFIIGVMTIPMLNAFGGEKRQLAWSIVSALYALLALVALLIFVIYIKEKDGIKILQKGKEKMPIKMLLRVAIKNKYYLIAMLLFLTSYIITGLAGINIYYAKDVLGNSAFYGLITVAGGAAFLSIVIAPKLFLKFGKRNIMMISMAVVVVSCACSLILPNNAVLFISMQAVKMIGLGPFFTALFTLAADNVDYGEWKTGIRAEGFTFSSNSFGMKVGTGLGSALIGWMLEIGNYDGMILNQGEKAISAMIWAGIILPMIFAVIVMILLLFWDLDKKLPQAQKELLERKTLSELLGIKNDINIIKKEDK